MEPSEFILRSEVEHGYPSKLEQVALVILHGRAKERVELAGVF